MLLSPSVMLCLWQFIVQDHRSMKDPSRLFESMVVVGLHPNTDIQALQTKFTARKSECPGKFRSALGVQGQARVEPNIEPQVLFVYPPEKQLPLKYKDLLSFCFPGGVEVHSVERTPSMSELNEILLGQEHLKQSDQSFVFRLQVADDSTLYGCCMLVEEVVHKPSGLISTILEKQPYCSSLSRHILTTRRCYCIISRLPFFDLHFSILNSIFTEERLERVLKSIDMLYLESLEEFDNGKDLKAKSYKEDVLNVPIETSDLSTDSSTPKNNVDGIKLEDQVLESEFDVSDGVNGSDIVSPVGSDAHYNSVDEFITRKQPVEKCFPEALLPLLRCQQYESSESSTR
ncbi:hypothetical protein GIB67_040342 [Kingdonia uniflora]|uniref:uDENN domain-containing protein n=1 Tax=Kingdonia uniflora TaxID=39325 RepID=A0A7J7L977_9MAGN|nr:hypothetical protein GIB67_040342 [Kingdonia uniflora]